MVERGIKDHSIRWFSIYLIRNSIFNLSNSLKIHLWLKIYLCHAGYKLNHRCFTMTFLNFFRTNKLENTDSVLRNIESVTITLGLKIFRLLVLGFLILNQIPIIGFVAISNTDGFCLLVSQFPKSTYWSTYLLFDRK